MTARIVLRLALVMPLLAAPAVAQELERTHPGHVEPPRLLPWLPPPQADAKIAVPPQTIVWVVRDTPYWRQGRLDPVLTNACRLGRFLPVESIFRVAFQSREGGAVLTAVPKGRHADLLVDPTGLARKGEIYYFRNEGQVDCEVRYDGPQPPRLLNGDGTSLPRIGWEQRKAKALQRIDEWRKARE